MADARICAVDGCDKKKHAHGYCARHAYHFKAHGDPLGGRKGSSPGEPLRWLLSHVDLNSDKCLVWPFEVSRWGYGTIKHNGQKRVASRVMCELAHGAPSQRNMDAAHRCNNRKCCNPKHLRWATRSENNLDMHGAGTAMRGEKVVFAKLTEAEVLEIRRIGASKPQREIALQFGVRASAVSRILSGKRWGWLTDGQDVRGPSGRFPQTHSSQA